MKKILLITLTMLTGLIFLYQQPVFATSTCSGGFSAAKCSACSGLSELGSSQRCSSNGSTVKAVIAETVSVLSYIVGIAAIIMIIISAIRFVISGGNSNSVEQAKKMLVYAIIGLVLAALAQILVRMALTTSTHIVGDLFYRITSKLTLRH
jgi:hypothetical protein